MLKRLVDFNPFYQRLASWARQGSVQRHLSYAVAGTVSLVGVRPCLPSQRRSSLASDVAGATVLIVAALILMSFALAALQPLLAAIGGLTLERAIVAMVLAVVLCRYAIGRSLILAVMACQDAGDEAAEAMSVSADGEAVNSEAQP